MVWGRVLNSVLISADGRQFSRGSQWGRRPLACAGWAGSWHASLLNTLDGLKQMHRSNIDAMVWDCRCHIVPLDLLATHQHSTPCKLSY
jgi:hypothetical protein